MKQVKWIAATAVLLLTVGCSTKEGVTPPSDLVPIQLHSGVWSLVSSKAPVETDDEFTAEVCGWEGMAVEGAAAVSAWLAAPTWKSTSKITAATDAAAMVLTPSRSYDKDGATTTVRAWYPAGTLAAGVVSIDNPDAEVDMMLSKAVSGTAAVQISESVLFKHLSTQLRFVALDNGWVNDENITKVVVKSVKRPTGIDLGAGLLTSGAEADLVVPGIETVGVPPGVPATSLGRSVMILPIDAQEFMVDITTSAQTYSNVKVTTTDAQFTAGKAYKVTLSFNAGNTPITVKSSVEEWEEGEASGGVIK